MHCLLMIAAEAGSCWPPGTDCGAACVYVLVQTLPLPQEISLWLVISTVGAALCMQLPYMAVADLNNPTENYPDIVSYTAISFMRPEDTPKAVELVTAAFDNATTPQTFIVVEPVANGTKSNNDTAFGWRGLDFIIVSTPSTSPCVKHSAAFYFSLIRSEHNLDQYGPL